MSIVAVQGLQILDKNGRGCFACDKTGTSRDDDGGWGAAASASSCCENHLASLPSNTIAELVVHLRLFNKCCDRSV